MGEFVMHERKRKLKKKLRKRKAAMKGSDDENDLDYKHEPKEPRVKKEKKDKKKKSRDGEKMYHEFSKYSSGSDGTGMEDESDIAELYQEIAEEEDDIFATDHEFSCESDDDEKVTVKHARTRTKDDEFPCKKCGHGDHPEWILLCDECDAGWHASCLRPALMVIPEGDWFCPDCSHKSLLSSLEERLVEFEVILKKADAEKRRKERLDFVNKSLNKALPTTPIKKPEKKPYISSESSSSSDSEDEPMMLRKCRTGNVKYNTEEYDQMIKKALATDGKTPLPKAISSESDDDSEEEEDEVEKDSPGKPKSGQGRGKDIGNGQSEDEEADAANDDDDGEDGPKPLKMKINKNIDKKKKAAPAVGKKKKKRMTDLNASDDSGDGDSGSDFV